MRRLILFGLIFSGCVFSSRPSHLMRAEAFRKNGQYTEAIAEYEAYIAERLKNKDFTPDQSPYFYYLLVGDSYLGLGRPDDAEKAYVKALENGTEKSMVSGKMRGLSDWFESRQEYETAIEILKRHHELDPLLFDLEIDQLHKKMIELEDKDGSLSGEVRY